MKKHIIILTIALMILPMFTQVAFAQVLPPGPPPTPPGVPFGAIEILLLGLAGYGTKKYFDKE